MITQFKEHVCRVLLIEDEDRQLHAIRRTLGSLDYRCEFAVAKTVREARKILRQSPPFDLAIVDLVLMSKPSGLSILGPAKPLDPWMGQTRVIVYTANPDWETARTAYEIGASAYISKLEDRAYAKLREKAKKLLKLPDLRKNLRLRFQAQKAAEIALRKHYKKWVRQYGSKMVLVKDAKVLSQHENPLDACRQLATYPQEERLGIGVIGVPER